MSLPPLTISVPFELLEQPFTIHSLNNYAHMGLTNLVEHLNLQPEDVRKIIRAEHHNLVTQLKVAGEIGRASCRERVF